MGVHPHDTGEPIRGAADLHHHVLEHLGAHRQRAGEPVVFARRADTDATRHREPGHDAREPRRDLLRDPGIGIEREMRSVLFGAAERHDEHGSVIDEVGPPEICEVHGRVADHSAR